MLYDYRRDSKTNLLFQSVMVRWSPPLPKQRNGEITSYKLRYKFRDRGSRGHVVSVEGPENQHVLSNLDRGEAYLVRVAAVTVKGQGPYSAWVPVEMTTADTNDGKNLIDFDLVLALTSILCRVAATWSTDFFALASSK